ncbi:hypothetical protein MT390_02990 [Vibrio sp. 2-Bac 85]
MDFIINDIEWWKISLYSFMNGWLPGVFTFLLGLYFERITSRRKLKQELKNNLLEIFIPTFNSGESITLTLAEESNRKLKAAFNAYKRIYPEIFNEQPVQELSKILADGFWVEGKVNGRYVDPDCIQGIISKL